MAFSTLCTFIFNFMSAQTISPSSSGFPELGTLLGWVFTWAWEGICLGIYNIIRWLLAFLDFMQYFVQKLIGLDYWLNRTYYTLEGAVESDLIFGFLYDDTVQKVFRAMMAVFFVLLIIFTIYAIVKQEWTYITGKEFGNGTGNSKTKIFKSSLKAIALVIIFPLVLMIGILSANAILASLIKALNIDTSSTLGGQLFQIASQNANKYEKYGNGNARAAVSDEVSFYITPEGKYLKLSNINENSDKVESVSTYEQYLERVAVSTKYTVNTVFPKIDPGSDVGFGKGTATFYGYCAKLKKGSSSHFVMVSTSGADNSTTGKLTMYYYLNNVLEVPIVGKDGNGQGFGQYSTLKSKMDTKEGRGYISGLNLKDLSSGSIADACYNTWNYSSIYDKTYGFETGADFVVVRGGTQVPVTYKSGGSTEIDVIGSGTVTSGSPSLFEAFGLGDITSAKVMFNSDYLSQYFDGGQTGIVQLQSEYLVMSEVINFMCESNLRMYMLDITSNLIDWSGHGSYVVGSRWISVADGKLQTKKVVSGAGKTNEIAPFVVSYGDDCNDTEMGNVMYFANKDAGGNELRGAKYIMCLKVESEGNAKYIPLINNKTYRDPVTGSQYNFKSEYLASNYQGVILAKGILDSGGNDAYAGSPTYLKSGARAQTGTFKVDDGSLVGTNTPYYYDMVYTGSFNQYAENAGENIDETWQVDSLNVANLGNDTTSYTIKLHTQYRREEQQKAYDAAVEAGETPPTLEDIDDDVHKYILLRNSTSDGNTTINQISPSNDIIQNLEISLVNYEGTMETATYTGQSSGSYHMFTSKGYYFLVGVDAEGFITVYTAAYTDADENGVNDFVDKNGNNVYERADGDEYVYGWEASKVSEFDPDTHVAQYPFRMITYTYRLMYDYVDAGDGLPAPENAPNGWNAYVGVNIAGRDTAEQQAYAITPNYFEHVSTGGGRSVYQTIDMQALVMVNTNSKAVTKTLYMSVSFNTSSESLVTLSTPDGKPTISFAKAYNLEDDGLENTYANRSTKGQIRRSRMAKFYLYSFYTASVGDKLYKYDMSTDAGKISEITTRPSGEGWVFECKIDDSTFSFPAQESYVHLYDGKRYVATVYKVAGNDPSYAINSLNDLPTRTTYILYDNTTYYNVQSQNRYDYVYTAANPTSTVHTTAEAGSMYSYYQDIQKTMVVTCARANRSFQFWEIDFAFVSLIPWKMRFEWQWWFHTLDRGWTGKEFYMTDGIQFDYFFEDTALSGNSLITYYIPSEISYWIILIASALMIKVLGTAIWGVIKRIYEITLYFLAAPAVASTIPLDDGQRFTTAIQQPLVKKVLSTYGVMLGLNVFFILLYPIKTLSQIFTAEDIAVSNSYFLKNFFSFLPLSFKAKVLNLYVYILFVLVAFTMISALPGVISQMLGADDVHAQGKQTKEQAGKAVQSALETTSGNGFKKGIGKAIDSVKQGNVPLPGAALAMGAAKGIGKGIGALKKAGKEGYDSAGSGGGGGRDSAREEGEDTENGEQSEEDKNAQEVQNQIDDKVRQATGGQTLEEARASGDADAIAKAEAAQAAAEQEIENNGTDAQKAGLKKLKENAAAAAQESESGDAAQESAEAGGDKASNAEAAAEQKFNSSVDEAAGQLGGDSEQMRANAVKNMAGKGNANVSQIIASALGSAMGAKGADGAPASAMGAQAKMEAVRASMSEADKQKFDSMSDEQKQAVVDQYDVSAEVGEDGNVGFAVTKARDEKGNALAADQQTTTQVGGDDAKAIVDTAMKSDEADAKINEAMAADENKDAAADVDVQATNNIALTVNFSDPANDPIAEQIMNDVMSNPNDAQNGEVIDKAMLAAIKDDPKALKEFQKISGLSDEAMKDDDAMLKQIEAMRNGGLGLPQLAKFGLNDPNGYKDKIGDVLQESVQNGDYQVSGWDLFNKSGGDAVQEYVDNVAAENLIRNGTEQALEQEKSKEVLEANQQEEKKNIYKEELRANSDKVEQLFKEGKIEAKYIQDVVDDDGNFYRTIYGMPEEKRKELGIDMNYNDVDKRLNFIEKVNDDVRAKQPEEEPFDPTYGGKVDEWGSINHEAFRMENGELDLEAMAEFSEQMRRDKEMRDPAFQNFRSILGVTAKKGRPAVTNSVPPEFEAAGVSSQEEFDALSDEERQAAEDQVAQENADFENTAKGRSLFNAFKNSDLADGEKVDKMLDAYTGIDNMTDEQKAESVQALNEMGVNVTDLGLMGHSQEDLIKAHETTKLLGKEVNAENVKQTLLDMKSGSGEFNASVLDAMQNGDRGKFNTVAKMIADGSMLTGEELSSLESTAANNGVVNLSEEKQDKLISKLAGKDVSLLSAEEKQQYQEQAANMSAFEVDTILNTSNATPSEVKQAAFNILHNESGRTAAIEAAMASEQPAEEAMMAAIANDDTAKQAVVDEYASQMVVVGEKEQAKIEKKAETQFIADATGVQKKKGQTESEHYDAMYAALGGNVTELETETKKRTKQQLKDRLSKDKDYKKQREEFLKNNRGKNEDDFLELIYTSSVHGENKAKELAAANGIVGFKTKDDLHKLSVLGDKNKVKDEYNNFKQALVVEKATATNDASFAVDMEKAKTDAVAKKNMQMLEEGHGDKAMAMAETLQKDAKVMKEAEQLYKTKNGSGADFNKLTEIEKAAFLYQNMSEFEHVISEPDKAKFNAMVGDKKDIFERISDDGDQFSKIYSHMTSYDGGEENNAVIQSVKRKVIEAEYDKNVREGNSLSVVEDPEKMDAKTRKRYDFNKGILQQEMRDNPDVVGNLFKNTNILGQDKIIADIAKTQGMNLEYDENGVLVGGTDKDGKHMSVQEMKASLDNQKIADYMNGHEDVKDKLVALGAQDMKLALDSDSQKVSKADAVLSSAYLRTQVTNDILQTNEVTKGLDDGKLKELIKAMLKAEGRDDSDEYVNKNFNQLKTELALHNIKKDENGNTVVGDKDPTAMFASIQKLENNNNMFKGYLNREVTKVIDPATYDPNSSSQKFFESRSLDSFKAEEGGIKHMKDAIDAQRKDGFGGFRKGAKNIIGSTEGGVTSGGIVGGFKSFFLGGVGEKGNNSAVVGNNRERGGIVGGVESAVVKGVGGTVTKAVTFKAARSVIKTLHGYKNYKRNDDNMGFISYMRKKAGIDEFQRNADGSIKKDANGEAIKKGVQLNDKGEIIKNSKGKAIISRYKLDNNGKVVTDANGKKVKNEGYKDYENGWKRFGKVANKVLDNTAVGNIIKHSALGVAKIGTGIGLGVAKIGTGVGLGVARGATRAGVGVWKGIKGVGIGFKYAGIGVGRFFGGKAYTAVKKDKKTGEIVRDANGNPVMVKKHSFKNSYLAKGVMKAIIARKDEKTGKMSFWKSGLGMGLKGAGMGIGTGFRYGIGRTFIGRRVDNGDGKKKLDMSQSYIARGVLNFFAGKKVNGKREGFKKSLLVKGLAGAGKGIGIGAEYALLRPLIGGFVKNKDGKGKHFDMSQSFLVKGFTRTFIGGAKDSHGKRHWGGSLIAQAGKGIGHGAVVGWNAVVFKTAQKLPQRCARYEQWNKILENKINDIKNNKTMTRAQKATEIQKLESQIIHIQKPQNFYNMTIEEQNTFVSNQDKLKREAFRNPDLARYVKNMDRARRAGNPAALGLPGEMYHAKAKGDRKQRHLNDFNDIQAKGRRLRATAAMRNREVDYGDNFEKFAKTFLDKKRYFDMIKRYKLKTAVEYQKLTATQKEKERRKREDALAAQIARLQRAMAKKVARDNKVNAKSFMVERGVTTEVARYSDGSRRFREIQSNITSKGLSDYAIKNGRRTETALQIQGQALSIDKMMQEFSKFAASYKGTTADFASAVKKEFAKYGPYAKKVYDNYAASLKRLGGSALGKSAALEKSPIAVQQREFMKGLAQELAKCKARLSSSGAIGASTAMKSMFVGKTYTGATTKAEVALHKQHAEELNRLLKLVKEQRGTVSFDSLSKRLSSSFMADFESKYPNIKLKSEEAKKDKLERYIAKKLEESLRRVHNDKMSVDGLSKLQKLNGRLVNKSEISHSKKSATIENAVKTSNNPVYQNLVREFNSIKEKVRLENSNLSALAENLKNVRTLPASGSKNNQIAKLEAAIKNSQTKLNNLNSVMRTAERRKKSFESAFAQAQIKQAKVETKAFATNRTKASATSNYDFYKVGGTKVAAGTVTAKEVDMAISRYIAQSKQQIQAMMKSEIISKNVELKNYVNKQYNKLSNDFGQTMRLAKQVKTKLDNEIKKLTSKDTKLGEELKTNLRRIEISENQLKQDMARIGIDMKSTKLKNK